MKDKYSDEWWKEIYENMDNPSNDKIIAELAEAKRQSEDLQIQLPPILKKFGITGDRTKRRSDARSKMWSHLHEMARKGAGDEQVD